MPPVPDASGRSSSSSNSKNPLKGSVEIIPDRLYYCSLKAPPSSPKILLRNRQNRKVPTVCFNVDEELVYWNFFLDFGPLNLGQLYRFTIRLNQLLADHPEATILFYSSTDPAKRANAIFLICAWQVLELKRTPQEAFYGFSYYSAAAVDDADGGGGGGSDSVGRTRPSKGNAGGGTHQNETDRTNIADDGIGKSHSTPPPHPLSSIGNATVGPLPPFHDASPCACPYELTLMHCLQGLVKARQHKFFDWDNFDVEEYEHFEQVEHGDLNWIVQGRIMAFAGPSFQKTISPEGYCTLAPSDYIPYFKQKNVALVVRLNKKNYEEQDFLRAGIQHLDQFYLDGSCPPMKILQRVLSAFEGVPPNQAFAVHCKAGLGRTGTCIGAYLMKHYRMTAPEVISWMRICRPGCVIGPQQQFLQDLEPVMWQEGEIMRSLLTRIVRPFSNGASSRNQKKAHSSPESPKSVAKDSVDGRPGQAEALLAVRRQRHPSTPSSTRGGGSKGKPVPVTPDTVSTKASSSASSWRTPNA